MFESLGAGYQHTCGLKANGAAYCWGRNNQGELGEGTTADRMVSPTLVVDNHVFASISIDDQFSCGLKADGSAYCWGLNDFGQLGDGTNITTNKNRPVPVSGGHTFKSLTLGYKLTLGLLGDGSPYVWGLPQPYVGSPPWRVEPVPVDTSGM